MISNIGDQKLFDAAPSIARLILDRNGIVKRDGIGIAEAEQVSALIVDVLSLWNWQLRIGTGTYLRFVI